SSHTTSLTFFNAHGNSSATFSNSPAPVHHTVTPASRNCPATFLGPCFPLPPTFTAHPPLPNVRNTSTLPHSPPKPHSCPTTHSPSSPLSPVSPILSSPTISSLLFFPLALNPNLPLHSSLRSITTPSGLPPFPDRYSTHPGPSYF